MIHLCQSELAKSIIVDIGMINQIPADCTLYCREWVAVITGGMHRRHSGIRACNNLLLSTVRYSVYW